MRAYSMDLRERVLDSDAGMPAAAVAIQIPRRVPPGSGELKHRRRAITGEVAPRQAAVRCGIAVQSRPSCTRSRH